MSGREIVAGLCAVLATVVGHVDRYANRARLLCAA
jgi:hypothetical protein